VTAPGGRYGGRVLSVLRRLVPISAVLLLAALLPAAASAQTFSFANTQTFEPSQDAEDFGPANHYPGVINVAGIGGGTVKSVTLTAIGFSAFVDLDMALVSPNGAQVMLMSDACTGGAADPPQTWTFDDAAAEFVPQGKCPTVTKTYRPANYLNGEDDFGPGGPSGEFSTLLSTFDGGPAEGTWKLFMIDQFKGLRGFTMTGFSLNLDVEPPPLVPPVVPTQPAPTIIQVAGPPAPAPAPAPAPVAKKKTGKRATALAKCKKKKTPEARAKCRVKARKLPV
jgi:subtilisin-like proprotein convertase family protein